MRRPTEGALILSRGSVVFVAAWALLVLEKHQVLAHDVEARTRWPPAQWERICPQKESVLAPGARVCPLAVDDNSPPHQWQGIWAYPPYCVFENHGGDPDKERARYCLYTNTFFGEYGLSILARPEAAANITSRVLDAYHSVFPSPATVENLNAQPAYRIVDMPEKGGKGVLATRPIKRTETFMVDYAAVVGDLNIWGSVSEREGRPLLELAAERLVSPASVTQLSVGAGGEGVEGVIKANTFRTFMNGVPQKTLFPRISVSFFLPGVITQLVQADSVC